jgi:hemolysin activation/secretion protein
MAHGDVIYSAEVAEALDAANANPFRRVELVYKPSDEPGYADLVLETRDRFPFRPYLTYDNAGPVTIGRNRLGVGFSWGNAFGADQILAYQFTASTDVFGGGNRADGRDVTSFMSHSAYWSAPVFGSDRLIVFGAYERSRPDVGANFGLVGKSGQVSLRYQHRLPTLGGLRHTLEGGFDFKTTNNNLDFGGTRVSSQQTHVAQFLLSWSGTLPDRLGLTTLGATLVWSPGGLTAHNHDVDFQPSLTHAGRAGATADYVYFRLTAERLNVLPGGASFDTRLVAQISSRPLLETEQVSLGGMDTLRGYEPNSVNADEGIFISNELRSPEMNLGNDAHMHVLMFMDAAWLRNKFRLPGEVQGFGAASVGAGLRLNVATNLVVKGDFGWQLKHLPNQKSLGQLGMISVTVAY